MMFVLALEFALPPPRSPRVFFGKTKRLSCEDSLPDGFEHSWLSVSDGIKYDKVRVFLVTRCIMACVWPNSTPPALPAGSTP